MIKLLLLFLLFNQCLSNEIDFAGLVYYPPKLGSENSKSLSVPLVGSSIRADVRGLTVGIVAVLVYENPTASNLTCDFVFPLSNEAAIYQLEAVIGTRKLVAKIEEKEKARKIFQEAVDAGKKAVLLQNEKAMGDVFRLSIGNLPPYEKASITLGYVQPVDRMIGDGLLSVTLPIVLNPRYVPTYRISDRQFLNSTYSGSGAFIAVSDASYSFSFSAQISLGLNKNIIDVYPRFVSDRLDVVYRNDSKTQQIIADVNLMSSFARDHDFQLLIKPDSLFEPIVFLEPKTHQYYSEWLGTDVAAAWVIPPNVTSKADSAAKLEIWIVFDRSGSMKESNKIASGRIALARFVSSLPSGSLFNFISFGSNYVPMFESPVVLNNQNRQRALGQFETFAADMGGTEILEPLTYIYNFKPQEGFQKVIFLMTDGQVSNTKEVIALAGLNRRTTKVFTVGIGEGASTELILEVARASNGLSTFVRSSNDRIETKMLEMLSKILSPTLKNAKLEWSTSAGGSFQEFIPKKLPSELYNNVPFFQYATVQRFRGQRLTGSAFFTADNMAATKGCTTCELHFQLESDVASNENDTLPIHRLAAKAKLAEMIEQSYNSSLTAYEKQNIREDAIAISKATGVLCEYTAFVAVDSETDQPFGRSSVESMSRMSDMYVQYSKKQSSFCNRITASTSIQIIGLILMRFCKF